MSASERNLLFLDVDGVLNRWTNPSSTLLCEPECVRVLNRILDKTGAVVVLTSTLRELVHSGNMTLVGLEYLLRSHGIRCKLVGITESDDDERSVSRGEQIRRWRRKGSYRWCKTAILDDEDDEITSRGLGNIFVRVNGSVGLLDGADAERVIALLTGDS